MRAFWWFREGSLAGMARPGFNGTPWFEFPFEEAVLVGWIGQHPSGGTGMDSFQRHASLYGGKILRFYGIEASAAEARLRVLQDPARLDELFRSISRRSRLLDSHEVLSDRISFRFNGERLRHEFEELRRKGISRIVSLTEEQHEREELEKRFHTNHLSINDLDAPRIEQVEQLARLIRDAASGGERIAVHCLAGIGRTSTMLIAAHLLLGESLAGLKELIAARNPAFVFAGKQSEFIHSLAASLGTAQ